MDETTTIAGRAFALPAGDVAAELDVDPAVGLSADEAERRAAISGPNALEAAERTSIIAMVVEAATEPFVILLAVAGILAILLGEVRDGLLVLVGLVPIVGADIVTEYRGERALEALRDAAAPQALVRRSGTLLTVHASSLVAGDVVHLATGTVVPADLRLTSVDRLLVDRAVLTGESIPEPGSVLPDASDAPLVNRRSIAYSGTSVVGGRGEGIVVAIGRSTEFGRIAGGLTDRQRRRSPLQRELDRLVRILLVVAIGLIVITSGAGFLRGHDLGANVLAGISAAIAAIPEEPPILLAVILGLGAYRLLRRGVLVRRLNAEETLGAVDLILTDKTGTITRNRLEVASVRTPSGPVSDPVLELALLRAALRAEEDAWPREGVAPGSFSRALIAAVEDRGGSAALDAADLIDAVPATDELPVTMARSVVRKPGSEAGEGGNDGGDGDARADGEAGADGDDGVRSGAGADGDDGVRSGAGVGGDVVTDALGAPEAVLSMVFPPGAALLPQERRERDAWVGLLETAAASGERLVALASRIEDEPWEMRALVGFADPLRDGIDAAMATAYRAGIQTIVVTGDHPLTALAIARGAGLASDRAVTGEEVAAWSDERLAAELSTLHVVARSTPDQKERLVRVAREAGRTVAVTGDGVNDAPALHRADVAVAMGSGTAVAREASDLVLGDDSFATLMFGLAEGRRIVDNVLKGLVFLVSTHVALLGFLLIATLFGGSVVTQPLLPLQILWLELFIDLSTSVAFEREPPEPDLMERAPRRPEQPLLTNVLLARIALAGGFSAVAALLLLLNHGGGFEHARWLAYTALVASQAVRAYANRSLRTPLLRLGANGFLLLAVLIVLAVQVAIPFVPTLAEAFHATPLDAGDWLLVAAIALAPAALAEAIRGLTGRAWVA